jgi:hypothetical protein
MLCTWDIRVRVAFGFGLRVRLRARLLGGYGEMLIFIMYLAEITAYRVIFGASA